MTTKPETWQDIFREFYDDNESGGSSRWKVAPNTVEVFISGVLSEAKKRGYRTGMFEEAVRLKELKKGESWRRGYETGVEEVIKEFTSGQRCLSCGKIKDNPLSDWCLRCTETK